MRNLKKRAKSHLVCHSTSGGYTEYVRGEILLSEHVPGDGCFAGDNIDALNVEFSGGDVSGIDSTVPFDIEFPMNIIFRANSSPSIC